MADIFGHNTRQYAAGLFGGTAMWSFAMHEWTPALMFGGLSIVLVVLNAALSGAKA